MNGYTGSGTVLLYDGECGFCDSTVQFVLRHDRKGILRFAPLQSDFGRAVLARHASLGGVDSLVWVEGAGAQEKVRVKSDAALRVASYLGGGWKLATLSRILPRRLRDAAYDFFARHRYRWFGRLQSCTIPTAEQRARFIGL